MRRPLSCAQKNGWILYPAVFLCLLLVNFLFLLSGNYQGGYSGGGNKAITGAVPWQLIS